MVPATAKANRTSNREVRFLARAWASKKSIGWWNVSAEWGGRGLQNPPVGTSRSRPALLHRAGEERGAAFVAAVELEINRVLAEALDFHSGDVGDDLNRVALRASRHRDGDGNLHRGKHELAVIVADQQAQPLLAVLLLIET